MEILKPGMAILYRREEGTWHPQISAHKDASTYPWIINLFTTDMGHVSKKGSVQIQSAGSLMFPAVGAQESVDALRSEDEFPEILRRKRAVLHVVATGFGEVRQGRVAYVPGIGARYGSGVDWLFFFKEDFE